MRVNKPPMIYFGHLHLKYRGRNNNFIQDRSLTKVMIIEKDFNSKEELVVFLTTFDGTEIMFSMISSDLYIKENGKYELKEGQNHCRFELFLSDKIMLFNGHIAYEKKFDEQFIYKEDFEATIILDENALLLQTWIQHEQIIITN